MAVYVAVFNTQLYFRHKGDKERERMRFAIVIIAIVAVMGAFIALPTVLQYGNELQIEYTRERLSYTPLQASPVMTKMEVLHIADNGAVTYTVTDSEGNRSEEKLLPLDIDEQRRIKGLILDTGFLQIPQTDFAPAQRAAEVMQYTLKLDVEGNQGQKVIRWADPYEGGTIPPIVANVGSQLDKIIETRAHK
jgi:hypothetical protein